MLTKYLFAIIILVVFARVAQWWSTSLPRRGSRVRSPSRALNKNVDILFILWYYYLRCCNIFITILYHLREWLSGGAPPCQGGGRGFDPRLALFYFVRKSVFIWLPLFYLCKKTWHHRLLWIPHQQSLLFRLHMSQLHLMQQLHLSHKKILEDALSPRIIFIFTTH